LVVAPGGGGSYCTIIRQQTSATNFRTNFRVKLQGQVSNINPHATHHLTTVSLGLERHQHGLQRGFGLGFNHGTTRYVPSQMPASLTMRLVKRSASPSPQGLMRAFDAHTRHLQLVVSNASTPGTYVNTKPGLEWQWRL
jgi:hypothetical protein